MWQNVGNLRLLCIHVQIYMYFKVNVVKKLRPFEENAIIYFFSWNQTKMSILKNAGISFGNRKCFLVFLNIYFVILKKTV